MAIVNISSEETKYLEKWFPLHLEGRVNNPIRYWENYEMYDFRRKNQQKKHFSHD